MRKQINDALTEATRQQDKRRMATLRLINAAIKDRDIAVRGSGKQESVDDADIQQILQKMIKQRQESFVVYEQAGRLELAQQEREEVEIIREFLPRQLGEDEVLEAVETTIDDLNATCVRDMGKCMATLKERYPGQMDFGRASSMLKNILCKQGSAQSA
ncbi:MAG: GatB/YqeY domain-containing protein [Pseudomonadota bacterium]